MCQDFAICTFSFVFFIDVHQTQLVTHVYLLETITIKSNQSTYNNHLNQLQD